jgi:poly(A) polymerase
LFPIFVDLSHVRKTTLWRYFMEDREAGRQLLHLAFADLSASEPEAGTADPSRLRPLMKAIDDLGRAAAEETGRPGKLVSGMGVMETTGLTPGPEIGRLLDEVREAQLSGEIKTEEDAEAFLKRLAEK